MCGFLLYTAQATKETEVCHSTLSTRAADGLRHDRTTRFARFAFAGDREALDDKRLSLFVIWNTLDKHTLALLNAFAPYFWFEQQQYKENSRAITLLFVGLPPRLGVRHRAENSKAVRMAERLKELRT